MPSGLLSILRQESPLTFARYMELCLYHPEFGYYARAPRIGKRGDFFTSPAVHPVFGAALAKQALQIWELMGRPDDFVLMEAGAGEGYLALDILDFLWAKGYTFPYFILEPFPANRSRQEEILAPYLDRVHWFSSWEEVPSFRGLFLSNELFDSFPVHLVEKTADDLREVYVVYTEEKLLETLGGLSSPEILERVLPYASQWPEGYRTEVSLAYAPFLKELSKRLVAGAVLTIDYGYPRADYYHPDRYQGTLLAFYQHQALENPYLYPGRMDLTAHVDFTSLKELGERFGLVSLGFTTQAAFLVGLGVEGLLSELGRTSPRDIEALKMLILPQGMGSSHWVLLQARSLPLQAKFQGFSLSNRLHILG